MAATERLICAAADLAESGLGVRFEVIRRGASVPAFAVRFGGEVYAYLNRCLHVQVELDWTPGEFFDLGGAHLVCSTHGALYDPVTGACRGGPCRGGRLEPLPIHEHDGGVWLKEHGEILHG